MEKRENIHFEKYKMLINEIGQHAEFLEDTHRKYMKCKNGCDLCCIDFSIFPVEYYFILNEVETENKNLDLEDKPKNMFVVF